MRKSSYFQMFILAFFTLSLGTVEAATVSGSAKFTGKKTPKRKRVRMNADPACAKLNKGKKVLDESRIVNAAGGIKNVFVYLKGAKPSGSASGPAIFDQQACIYKPHVLVVRPNQEIQIKNSDATLHNVHSLPKKNKSFNSAMPKKGQVITKKFKKEEIGIKVKCDVHGWMAGYIHVLKHPYYAITNDDGSFSIPNVPPGDYELVAWHEHKKFKTQKQKIKVASADPAPVTFNFK